MDRIYCGLSLSHVTVNYITGYVLTKSCFLFPATLVHIYIWSSKRHFENVEPTKQK